MLTINRLQTHWPQCKEFIKTHWPKITETELARINGNFDVFLKYLKNNYGGFPMTEAIAREQLQKFVNALE